jgi:hypothetical protein
LAQPAESKRIAKISCFCIWKFLRFAPGENAQADGSPSSIAEQSEPKANEPQKFHAFASGNF